MRAQKVNLNTPQRNYGKNPELQHVLYAWTLVCFILFVSTRTRMWPESREGLHHRQVFKMSHFLLKVKSVTWRGQIVSPPDFKDVCKSSLKTCTDPIIDCNLYSSTVIQPESSYAELLMCCSTAWHAKKPTAGGEGGGGGGGLYRLERI